MTTQRRDHNSIESLFVTLGFNNHDKYKGLVQKFNLGENCKINYWRSEFRPSPFTIKMFTSIQAKMFDLGWLHTNFFYQSKGKLSLKTKSLLTKDFVENLIDSSNIVAYEAPLASSIINKFSIPIDEASVFIFTFTTEKCAKIAKDEFASQSYEGLKNLKVSDGQVLVYETNNTNPRPVIFIMNYPGLNIIKEIKDSSNLIPVFSSNSPSYKQSEPQKIKVLEDFFEIYKNEFLKKNNVIDIKSLQILKEHKEIDFANVYARVIDIFSKYFQKINNYSIQKHKERLIFISSVAEKSKIKKFPEDTINRFFIKSSEFCISEDNPYLNKFKNMDYPVVETFSFNDKDITIYDPITPSEISDVSYLKDVVSIFDEYNSGEFSTPDRELLEDVLRETCLQFAYFTDTPGAGYSGGDILYYHKNSFNTFVRIIRMTLTRIFSGAAYVNSTKRHLLFLDYREDSNLDILCEFIFDSIKDNISTREDSENIKALKDDVLKFIKFYIKEIFMISVCEINNKKYLKTSKMFLYKNKYFKTSNTNYYFPHYSESSATIIDMSYGGRPNSFAIDKDSGKICLLDFDINEDLIIHIILDPEYFGTKYDIFGEASKIINVYYFDVDEQQKLIKSKDSLTCGFYIKDKFDENGNAEFIKNYEELANYFYSEDSGLHVYDQYIDFMRSSTIKIIERLRAEDQKDSDIFSDHNKCIDRGVQIIECPIFQKFANKYLSLKINKITYYVDFIEDDPSEYEVYSKYDNVKIIQNDEGNSLKITTNPVIVQSNQKIYSLSRIKYSLFASGNLGRLSGWFPAYKLSEKNKMAPLKNMAVPYFALYPKNAEKYSAATTSYMPTGLNNDKSGHPHFSHRDFICNVGYGQRSYYNWLSEELKSGRLSDNDIIGYDEDFNVYYVKVNRKHFIQWLDSQIFDMDSLTKSCYNRKTRSHNGLNIEEWTHCRIE